MYMYRVNENLELHKELMTAQGRGEEERIRPYYASARREKDIDSLSEGNYSTAVISYMLEVPESLVKSRVARRQTEEQERRQFLSTGILPKTTTTAAGGYLAVVPKK